MSDFPMRCAWCGVEKGRSAVPGSHGICLPCAEQLVGVPLLSPESLDALPWGVIRLDGEGAILSYSRGESETSRLRPEDVLGRNFFRDVAPCTRVRQFEGRFREFRESDERIATFPFRFVFPHGITDVEIVFLRDGGDATWVFVRRTTSEPSKPPAA